MCANSIYGDCAAETSCSDYYIGHSFHILTFWVFIVMMNMIFRTWMLEALKHGKLERFCSRAPPARGGFVG